MTYTTRKILITGGCGFIGSALIRQIIRTTQHSVVNLDKMTYAATAEALEECAESDRYNFMLADIADSSSVREALNVFVPDGIINLAAESHVDRSIDGPAVFVDTNIMGTFVLLEEALRYFSKLNGDKKARFRFHHVSTDEVYGSLSEDDAAFCESTAYQPRSPYAASKAAADHLVQAWHETYALPVVLTNCSNNYGPWQFPEKLIPLTIVRALEEQPLLIYGAGRNTRDWVFVDDHAQALIAAFQHGKPGEKYHVGGGAEMRNVEVVKATCLILDELRPLSHQRSYQSLIRFVPDRPGHDYRYAMNCEKISRELGWSAKVSFDSGLRKTIGWYLQNATWWRGIRSTRYDGHRLGLAGRR